MISERVAQLRRQSLEARPTLSTERAELITQFYAQRLLGAQHLPGQQNPGFTSAPMRRALAFQYLMEHKTIYIGPGELIVGEKGRPIDIGQEQNTIPEIIACLRRVQRSIEKWQKRGGRRGYYEFVNEFLP